MREYFIWLFKLLTLVVIFFFLVPFLLLISGRAAKDDFSAAIGPAKNVVAVVELKGLIDSSKDVLEELYKQVKNEKVKGIVLRVDSPGGAVGPAQDVYYAVKQLKAQKPIVASMGAVAASGGLYAALAASKIYCEPGTITGSIGVILQVPNLTKVTERVGFDMVTIKSGQFKDVGNSFREMTEEDRAFLQSTVDAAHEEFIKAVAEGRSIDPAKVREFADGRILLGSQARDLKLVDEFGDIYAAARAVFEILGKPLPAGEVPTLHYPSEKFGAVKKLLEGLLKLPDMWSNRIELKYLMY